MVAEDHPLNWKYYHDNKNGLNTSSLASLSQAFSETLSRVLISRQSGHDWGRIGVSLPRIIVCGWALWNPIELSEKRRTSFPSKEDPFSTESENHNQLISPSSNFELSNEKEFKGFWIKVEQPSCRETRMGNNTYKIWINSFHRNLNYSTQLTRKTYTPTSLETAGKRKQS